jgi:polyphenol oxidase
MSGVTLPAAPPLDPPTYLAAANGLQTLLAANLRARHGFSSRVGGVSQGAFAGLNLSGRLGDQPALVAENRRRLLASLKLTGQLRLLTQVHGQQVIVANPANPTAVAAVPPEADALVTASPGLVLAIETADCYPLLLEDASAGVVGAAHAGWRGTLGQIAAATVAAMVGLGARAEGIQVAIGPGICAANYPVGAAVQQQFLAAGFPAGLFQASLFPALGTNGPHLDLAAANAWVLQQAGVPAANIWQAGRCSTEADFFSYRRDGGQTGRMWAVIGL